MSQQELQIFDNNNIRSYWDEEKEQWFFCISDVVQALTDSRDVKQYIKRLRQREPELNSVWGTICTPHQFLSSDGKRHSVNCTNTAGILRIVMSIPSPKAEPFKKWLANVGAERIQQMQDPELGIQQSLMDFKRLGYSDNWINQRLKSIEIRKDLTDQWKIHNVEEGEDYARLTDIIYHSWAGLTAREYKRLKGLHQENLRDNMTNEELVMNMLAELTTTNITKEEHPLTMDEHSRVAARGGSVARIAKEAYEQQTGKKVVSDMSMKRYLEGQQPQIPFEDEIKDGLNDDNDNPK